MENWKTILKEEGKAAAAAVLSRLIGLLLARLPGLTGSGKTEADLKTAGETAEKKENTESGPESGECRISPESRKFPENKKSGEK